MDAVKSHDALPVATWRDSSDIAHVPQEFSQVCCYLASYRRMAAR